MIDFVSVGTALIVGIVSILTTIIAVAVRIEGKFTKLSLQIRYANEYALETKKLVKEHEYKLESYIEARNTFFSRYGPFLDWASENFKSGKIQKTVENNA